MLKLLSRVALVMSLVALNAALFASKPMQAEQAKGFKICDLQVNPYTGQCDKYCVDWIFTKCDGNHCANDC